MGYIKSYRTVRFSRWLMVARYTTIKVVQNKLSNSQREIFRKVSSAKNIVTQLKRRG